MTEKVVGAVSNLLDHGKCEPFKAGVHGVGFILAGLCALYNTAAWLKRRERHLAVNAVVYGAAVWVERCHVMHHLAACRAEAPAAAPVEAEAELISAA